jgi:hypothetical protein
MTTITQDELKSLLTYDPATGTFRWCKTYSPHAIEGAAAGFIAQDGYHIIKLHGKKYKAHRLAWLYVTGNWPPQDIDHINRARNDNRFSNLRLATRAENCQNQPLRKTNTSGVTGVSYHKASRKWAAFISVAGQMQHLGLYVTLSAAVTARKKAELEHYPYANNPVLT